MYLEQFVADGYLDADGADALSWVTAQHASRIYLTVGERRLLAHNLPVCWRDLRVAPGTPISVEVSSGNRNLDDEQRAIAAFADRFREVLTPPRPRRTRFGFLSDAGARRSGGAPR
ncbi:hypothetical protein HUN08_01390 [Gordonia sp. X0973]|uniref:hypothetical protein n=1 Tax=Gordonia sp. X0973 TaxID=2742602 RepID=UPI000F52E256|nr:hypothetical protein [Gordonia sp. X0973]QKT05989.1 hypothetical protein HUN08_01390 [Gordonia sp. X0973]